MNAPTLEPKDAWIHDAGDHVAAIAWSHDGGAIVVAPSEGEIGIIERDTGTRRVALPGHRGGNTSVSASRREPLVATGGHDGHVRVWDTGSGALIRTLEVAPAWVEHVAFSPDGALLAATAGRTLRVWDCAGTLVHEATDHESTIAALAWRPDGRGIGTGCYNGVRLFRLGDPEPYELLRWKGSIISLAWSPSGRYVAGGSQEATIQFWKLPYREGEELFMSGYATKVKELAWDASSRFLASGGGPIITVWDVSGKGPRGAKPMQLEGHEPKVAQLAFQHRGPLLASADPEGRIFLWDLKSGTRHRRQVQPPAAISAMAWSADDSGLALGTADGTTFLWESDAPAPG